MLMPKRVKHRKMMRGTMKGKATGATTLDFGDYGLRALESGWITASQIEAMRVATVHYLKRLGKLWLRIFPDKPVSKKPAETRMGKGKGEPAFWVAPVRKGRILIELEGVSEKDAREALRRAAAKLPIKTRFIKREGVI
ncbi:50S ribosomal protein L16 [candidate division WOR-3 bacterium]|nr:50S ribosomal protein L16 [candidate division WOR-3 bacterium]MCK4526820.1 50S ribosomal protein L16 [candidate division WOR-3 bacterium]